MPGPSDALVELAKLFLIPGGIVTAFIAAMAGWKKGAVAPGTASATVVSATLADGDAVRELIKAIKTLTIEVCDSREQRHRDSLAERDVNQEVEAALRDLSQTMKHGGGPGLVPDFAGLIEKLSNK